MSVKPIEIKATGGVRNDVSAERFGKGDLVVGINVELDDTGKVYRRQGYSQIAAAAMHSLWSEGNDAFVVNAGMLSRVESDLSIRPLTAVTDRVAYVRIADRVFWSDGQQSGVISGSTSRRWGIAPPPVFNAQAVTVGSLRDGDYLYTMTFEREDGTESGAPLCGRISTAGAIFFPALPVSADPTVVRKHIYLSEWNGELPYRAMTLTNSVTAATISAPPPAGPALRTLLMGPAPAGTVLGYYNGRAYVARGRFLWYSRPYEYELFSPMDYIAFSTDVQTFAPVSDGVFVGSEDETVFLFGDDPAQFKRRQVCDYGTVRGTEADIPEYYTLDGESQGPQKMWMSRQGVCHGSDGGQFKNLTGGRYILPEGVVAGSSLLKVRGGTPQLVVSLFK